MAKLAIKGHETRGKEVIEILEMLGGINSYKINNTEKNLLYCLREGDNVIIATYLNSSITSVFTLERFLEKFPYKVGDKVKVCGDNLGVVISMRWEIDYVVYKVKLSKNGYETSKTSENLQPYKEAPIYLNEKANRQAEEMKLDIPDGYEFFGIDDDNKIVLTKKQPQYPKTYKECCDALGLKTLDNDAQGYKAYLIINLQELLIARDAYWKIAGEQMGLDKPWEPENLIKHYIFIIENCGGVIIKNAITGTWWNRILVFPTEDMQDAFYDNFKDLIEECKEFL